MTHGGGTEMAEDETASQSPLEKGWRRFTRVFSTTNEGGAEMAQDRKQILDMLAEGKINVDEAERLLTATAEITGRTGVYSSSTETPDVTRTRKAKYLRVLVTPPEAGGDSDTPVVNVRVPLNIIRAGIKLKALIPPEAGDKVNEALASKGINMDLRNIKDEDIEELINALSELEVDVQEPGGAKVVRVYVE